jgi:hypothetical protein
MSRIKRKIQKGKALMYVPQIDEDGCAVAAFAMLARTSYYKAGRVCFPRNYNTSKAMSPNELASALRKFGVKTIRSTQISRHWNKPFTISFDWATAEGGHFVVWCPVARKFLDPGYTKALRNDIYLRGWRKAIRTMIGAEAIVLIES